MKYKINLFKIFILLVFFCIGGIVYAQEDSSLGKLTEDYITRLAQTSRMAGDYIESNNVVVVDQGTMIQNAVTESMDTISKTVIEMREEEQKVIDEIKMTVKTDIDDSIVQIRKETDVSSYDLQNSIDSERTQLFEDVTQTIESVGPTTNVYEEEKIQNLQTKVDIYLDKIQDNLETESGQSVTFERSQRDIKETLLRFQKILEEKKKIIESRQGELVFKDTDSDGVSDYDEIYIYKTDPNNPRTKGEGKTDGEKIIEGINPLSDTEEKINFQDPREDKESFVSESYNVNKVELIKNEKENLLFEGSALPNTYVTLYIYSTPIIVTVKTNSDGQWNYMLEKEVENGEHQIFVANVDTSGKIIARSNPILFTKTAEAAVIGIMGDLEHTSSKQNFLKDNFILIIIAVLIIVVIVGMILVGNHKNIKSAILELHNEVSNKN